jgi:hypothetical protein
MQGFRLDPQENDDNSVPDTCEVGFETTIHSNNVIQLIWTSHPIEIVKVESYYRHLAQNRLWLSGTRPNKIDDDDGLIKKLPLSLVEPQFPSVEQPAINDLSSSVQIPGILNIINKQTKVIDLVDLSTKSNPSHVQIPEITLINSNLNIQPSTEINYDVVDHNMVENISTTSSTNSKLSEPHRHDEVLSPFDIFSHDIISFPHYDSKAPYQRSDQHKNETFELYTNLQKLYKSRNIDTKYTSIICGQKKTFATFRFPATNGVLDIRSKKVMFFVDADTLNDPLFVTYKYQCCIATATVKRGLEIDGKYQYHGIVHMSLCALGHAEFPIGRFVLLQVK